MKLGSRVTGFTYLVALFAVAVVGVGLASLGQVLHIRAQREKEAQLLFVGNQYRRAIERYYITGPRVYPRTLQDLLNDPRTPTIQRHLRQLYPDPMTGKTDWAVVKAPDGGIMGVNSRTEDRPMKIANFAARDRIFEGAEKYSDWKFLFIPAPPR